MNDIARVKPDLTTVEGDIEKAAKYKARLGEHLKPVCEIITEAKREGILLSYQTMNDGMGKQFISSLTAVKEL